MPPSSAWPFRRPRSRWPSTSGIAVGCADPPIRVKTLKWAGYGIRGGAVFGRIAVDGGDELALCCWWIEADAEI
jgi:hypothetical protein